MQTAPPTYKTATERWFSRAWQSLAKHWAQWLVIHHQGNALFTFETNTTKEETPRSRPPLLCSETSKHRVLLSRPSVCITHFPENSSECWKMLSLAPKTQRISSLGENCTVLCGRAFGVWAPKDPGQKCFFSSSVPSTRRVSQLCAKSPASKSTPTPPPQADLVLQVSGHSAHTCTKAHCIP